MATICERVEDEIIRQVYIGGHRLSADVTPGDIEVAEKAYTKIAELSGYMASLCAAIRQMQPNPLHIPF